MGQTKVSQTLAEYKLETIACKKYKASHLATHTNKHLFFFSLENYFNLLKNSSDLWGAILNKTSSPRRATSRQVSPGSD
jgi:hypothetical protein